MPSFSTLRRESLLATQSPRSPKLGPWSQHVSPLLCLGLCLLPASMAELRQIPGGRETPQGELRPEVVEDEVPRSPVAEEPGGGGSNSSEAKLSPREEEELDPRIQVRNMYNIMYETSRQSRFHARYWMLGAGALGRPRGRVWGGRREEGSGWGTHVYLWRIHFDIWQNQYNIVKLKKKKEYR